MTEPASAPRSKKRNRVLTESRRRQNRESQRRYRERRKATQVQRSSPSAIDGGVPSFQDDLDVNILGPYNLASSSSHDDTLYGLSDFFGCESPSLNLLVAEHPTPMRNLTGTPSPSRGRRPQSNLSQSSTLPSPYINYLQIQKLNFYAARIQNALYIGVPLKLAEAESFLSPWYLDAQWTALVSASPPDVLSDSDTTSLSNTTSPPSASGSSIGIMRPVRVRPCFELSKSVMSDLAPTPLQRSYPHGMYLDLIPFPVFRDRVITMLSMDPPAFDESELKHDIEADGLLVWGVAQGTRDRSATLVRDRRNWECSKWFFEKWKLLVNGSGLEEQSRWWRRMRGDDECDEDEEEPGAWSLS
ncbi:uncharacterized protein BDZ99DRAFT_576080 [Mytilinidion resinicola]|uniref:BZIP domain-containing protein n=1 Tax=Mytilinidion resinicola TaxID=574789 RepID=A0A6A6Y486_9PEZI|nr:uncharacterized protein BDZ99DRAFT_576080 [Mytilinidion resinicola]KAF2803602.1 hypothetical protein BDZ99DRAFT_576080 [Mytilinidion resinicola]